MTAPATQCWQQRCGQEMQGHNTVTQLVAIAIALLTALAVLHQLHTEIQPRRPTLTGQGWSSERLEEELKSDESLLKQQSETLENIENSLKNQEKVLHALKMETQISRKEVNNWKNQEVVTPKDVPKKDGDEWEKTSDVRLKVLLISRGRSGSSLLGELLSLHPSSSYYFEPLAKVRGGQFQLGLCEQHTGPCCPGLSLAEVTWS